MRRLRGQMRPTCNGIRVAVTRAVKCRNCKAVFKRGAQTKFPFAQIARCAVNKYDVWPMAAGFVMHPCAVYGDKLADGGKLGINSLAPRGIQPTDFQRSERYNRNKDGSTKAQFYQRRKGWFGKSR